MAPEATLGGRYGSERRGGEDASGRQDAAWPGGRSCSSTLPSLRLGPVTIPEAQGDLSPSSQTSGTSKHLVAVQTVGMF